MLVDTEGFEGGKVSGEIKDVIRDEKSWKKMTYWYILLSFNLRRPNVFNQKCPKEESSEEEIGNDGNDVEEEEG